MAIRETGPGIEAHLLDDWREQLAQLAEQAEALAVAERKGGLNLQKRLDLAGRAVGLFWVPLSNPETVVLSSAASRTLGQPVIVCPDPVVQFEDAVMLRDRTDGQEREATAPESFEPTLPDCWEPLDLRQEPELVALGKGPDQDEALDDDLPQTSVLPEIEAEPEPAADAWLTTEQVAVRCGVQASTVSRWRRDGCPPEMVARSGRSYTLSPEAVALFIEQQRKAKPEPIPEASDPDWLTTAQFAAAAGASRAWVHKLVHRPDFLPHLMKVGPMARSLIHRDAVALFPVQPRKARAAGPAPAPAPDAAALRAQLAAIHAQLAALQLQ